MMTRMTTTQLVKLR